MMSVPSRSRAILFGHNARLWCLLLRWRLICRMRFAYPAYELLSMYFVSHSPATGYKSALFYQGILWVFRLQAGSYTHQFGTTIPIVAPGIAIQACRQCTSNTPKM